MYLAAGSIDRGDVSGILLNEVGRAELYHYVSIVANGNSIPRDISVFNSKGSEELPLLQHIVPLPFGSFKVKRDCII